MTPPVQSGMMVSCRLASRSTPYLCYFACKMNPHRLLISLALFAGSLNAAMATEPLNDRVTIGKLSGRIYQPGRGELPLPPSERVRAIALSESCSARGGPRGLYKQEGNRFWLVGLYRCSGELALHDVYPEAPEPWFAAWINGAVVAKLGGVACRTHKGIAVYEHEVTFIVENGVVKSRRENANDSKACQHAP